MQCKKCGYRRFKSVAMVNTSQGCSKSTQYLLKWSVESGVLNDHPQCIIRRKQCVRCGTVVRTMEVVIAQEKRRHKPKWRHKKVATTVDWKAVKTLL